ncbi:NmrA-like domain [Sesbania bispinosa]|nr:NmrA-like domain [Sesbania bispinosa]
MKMAVLRLPTPTTGRVRRASRRFAVAPSTVVFPFSLSAGTGRVGVTVKCSGEVESRAVGAVNVGPGTPVRPTSILVVGSTGTLGRQIVRRALDEGYDVRCLVRPRPAPADFLRDWGATVADLSKPDTIPATLVGVHTVIDCATGRPEEPIKTVDWEGKVALIQCAKAMGIQKYVFYSIHNCDKHPEVPLMEIKYCTEKFLRDSGLNHVIIRLCGFMQGLIGQYAVPILEEKSVWGTDAPTRIAYMDTQDIARLTFIALRNEKINGKLLTFAGPRAWTTQEVITLCERLAGQDANVTTVPVSILRLTRQLTRYVFSIFCICFNKLINSCWALLQNPSLLLVKSRLSVLMAVLPAATSTQQPPLPSSSSSAMAHCPATIQCRPYMHNHNCEALKQWCLFCSPMTSIFHFFFLSISCLSPHKIHACCALLRWGVVNLGWVMKNVVRFRNERKNQVCIFRQCGQQWWKYVSRKFLRDRGHGDGDPSLSLCFKICNWDWFDCMFLASQISNPGILTSGFKLTNGCQLVGPRLGSS